jgi:hypothetical protein
MSVQVPSAPQVRRCLAPSHCCSFGEHAVQLVPLHTPLLHVEGSPQWPVESQTCSALVLAHCFVAGTQSTQAFATHAAFGHWVVVVVQAPVASQVK